MKALLRKWYFSLVILPLVINYVSSAITSEVVIKDWKVTVIMVACILITILVLELMALRSNYKLLLSIPRNEDKRIVNDLLGIFDLDKFHEEIVSQNAWYGYKKEAIWRVLSFLESAQLPTNKPSDSKLNRKLSSLRSKLSDFNNYSASKLFSTGKFFAPDKNTEFGAKQASEATPILNKMAEDAYEALNDLMEYLRQKRFFEP